MRVVNRVSGTHWRSSAPGHSSTELACLSDVHFLAESDQDADMGDVSECQQATPDKIGLLGPWLRSPIYRMPPRPLRQDSDEQDNYTEEDRGS